MSGLAKVPVKYDDAPLLLPARVADARSGPVGRLPLVALTDRVRLGAVPVQPEQKRLMSAFVSCPVTAAVNVYPPQVVVFMPTPKVLRVVFCWSILAAFNRVTSPGLVVTSTLVGIPVWKSLCVVSVMHPLLADVFSEKS